MLDIEGIKQQVNEIVQLTESSKDRTVEILANNLATIDNDFYNEFVSNGGDDSNFKSVLKSCCEEWVYNSSYQYGERQPSYGNPWVKANNIYFNLDDIWDDWRGYCEHLPDYEKFQEPKDDGKKWLDETTKSSNSDVDKLFNTIKNGEGMQDVYYDNGGENFEKDLRDRCEEYVYDEIYHLDKPYQDYNWIRINGTIYNYDEIWSDWKDFCEHGELPDAPKDDGKKWLDESVEENKLLKAYKDIKEEFARIITGNCEDGARCEYFIMDVETFLDNVPNSGYDESMLLNEILNIGQGLGRRYIDFEFVQRETDGYDTLDEYIDDATSSGLIFYMSELGRREYLIEVYNLFIKYCDSHQEYLHSSIEDEPGNIKAPKESGDEYLEEQVLMEMPATNYTRFDIEPYIVCDPIYYEDEEGNTDYDIEPELPLYDLVSHRESNPSWVRELFNYSRESVFCMPELNKTLNTYLVCIIGIAGYYEGMTVGIVEHEIDYDLLREYFEELGGTDPEGHTLYCLNGDESQAFTEKECDEYIKEKIIKPEIEKAKQILIEAQYRYGGKLYPSEYEYKKPDTTGEEFDESVKNNKTLVESNSNLPDPGWIHIGMDIGDTYSGKYMGYPIFIECCRDEDGPSFDEDAYFYNFQIYSPNDKYNEDPIDETNWTVWEDMIDHLKEYVKAHPTNVDEPEGYMKKPEETGEEFDESVQLDEEYDDYDDSEDSEFEYWRNHPLDTDEGTAFSYRGYEIDVDNMEDDHFNVSMYRQDVKYPVYEFFVRRWEDLFNQVEIYVRRHPLNLDEPKNIKKPNDDGHDWVDESLDLKGIKNQINEIVRKADGNN